MTLEKPGALLEKIMEIYRDCITVMQPNGLPHQAVFYARLQDLLKEEEIPQVDEPTRTIKAIQYILDLTSDANRTTRWFDEAVRKEIKRLCEEALG